MALTDLFSNFHLLFRWIHILAGITWIGHLYFFNFVNIQFQASIDDATKKTVNAPLILRALWWFRWGAMITFLSGLILFTMIYMYVPGLGFGPSELFSDAAGLTGRAVWILIGMTLGFIMWFNVWFIIWPTQRRLFSGGYSGDAIAAARKRAGKASRINTHLSAPMLMGMVAAPHYGAANFMTIVVFVLIAGAVPPLLYKLSLKAGTAPLSKPA